MAVAMVPRMLLLPPPWEAHGRRRWPRRC